VLPSLIATFHLTKDHGLQDKVIEVMRRCFSQKTEFFENLHNLEILFDENEINAYNFL
jgi:inositol 1,4,5-triphosphate receptor type 1/inositol 1,4,5-triphosphate receptor type 3